ncbi:hypothetical protein M569_13372 [Genlisea aurea]|uniref:DUF4283 domain-containing protein n=1 Tax=Genlisea aurea TaxID=192259 RepID=S8CAN7_9LAMI|nr:hypothetical protein M569_13372 [Genlisea aurea]
MEPDLLARFTSISLAEEESLPVVFPNGMGATNEADTGLYLVGKILHPRPVNPETVAKQMHRAFNPLKELTVKFLGDNKFLFRFEHLGDCLRVEEGSPWHFENHLFVLNRVPPGGYAGSVALNKCPFSVQIHNLPFLSFPRGSAEILGNRIGEFLYAEIDAKGSSKVAALRLRVALDIRKPLIRALKVPSVDGEMVTAAITYEKLPIFCSECGMLDHQLWYCKAARDVAAKKSANSKENDPSFGPWLRAAKARILETTISKKTTSSGTSSSAPPPEGNVSGEPSAPETKRSSGSESEKSPVVETQDELALTTEPGMMMIDLPREASPPPAIPVLPESVAMEGIVRTRKRAPSTDSRSTEDCNPKGTKISRTNDSCSSLPAEAAMQPRPAQ